MTAHRGHEAQSLPKRVRDGSSLRGLSGPVIMFGSRQRGTAGARSGFARGLSARCPQGCAAARRAARGRRLKNQNGRNLLPPGIRSSGGTQRVIRPGHDSISRTWSIRCAGEPAALEQPDPLALRALLPGGSGTVLSADPRSGLPRSAAPWLRRLLPRPGEVHDYSKPFVCIPL